MIHNDTVTKNLVVRDYFYADNESQQLKMGCNHTSNSPYNIEDLDQQLIMKDNNSLTIKNLDENQQLTVERNRDQNLLVLSDDEIKEIERIIL